MARNVKRAATSFGNIAYEEEGSGSPALFVHGVFLNGYHWRHVVNRLAGQRRCIALDILAHGMTGATSDQDLSFTAQAQMLEAFCQSLKLDQIDLVATDSGGGIAQIFAARHPHRIRSLVLTNCDTHDGWPPPAFQQTVQLAKGGQLAAVGQKMLADPEFARSIFARTYEHPEQVSAETLRTYLEPLFATAEAARNLERFIAAQDCRHTVAVESLLRKLQAPTLVVWGTGDVFFDVKWAHWLRDAIPGCSKIIELEGARLFFPEERPDALAAAIRDHWQAGAAARSDRVA